MVVLADALLPKRQPTLPSRSMDPALQSLVGDNVGGYTSWPWSVPIRPR